MIALTYLEDVDYLLGCFKVWQYAWGRFADELWVAAPEALIPSLPKGPKTRYWPAIPLGPDDYPPARSIAATMLPLPGTEPVWFVDPDTIVVGDTSEWIRKDHIGGTFAAQLLDFEHVIPDVGVN